MSLLKDYTRFYSEECTQDRHRYKTPLEVRNEVLSLLVQLDNTANLKVIQRRYDQLFEPELMYWMKIRVICGRRKIIGTCTLC